MKCDRACRLSFPKRSPAETKYFVTNSNYFIEKDFKEEVINENNGRMQNIRAKLLIFKFTIFVMAIYLCMLILLYFDLSRGSKRINRSNYHLLERHLNY